MCIRDSFTSVEERAVVPLMDAESIYSIPRHLYEWGLDSFCLLYTSDAADERSSVDLGGRRIIKKKNNMTLVM